MNEHDLDHPNPKIGAAKWSYDDHFAAQIFVGSEPAA
jgi:hypothetical protein